MDIIKIRVLTELTEYKRLVSHFSDNLFSISDTFIKTKLNEVILEQIFNYELDISTEILITLHMEDLIKKFSDSIDDISNRFKYNCDLSFLENNIENIITRLVKAIIYDVMFKIRELSIIHIGFNVFPKVKLLKDFNAELIFEIQVVRGLRNERDSYRRQ